MLEDCVLTVLELNWNQRFGDNRTKLNICHRMLTSSTHLQMKNARAKRAKVEFFFLSNMQISGGFSLPSSSWLLKGQFDQFQTSSNNFQQVATTRNNTQHGVQTLATCWAQQCCVLLANNVASVCTGLKATRFKSVFFS